VHIHEAARRICEDPPARPSTIDASLRGDLETIVLAALEKDPARRFASAFALGEDVRRFLANEPILARRPSGLYQARKLVERHRLASALIASIFVFAIGAAIWMSVLYRNESRLRKTSDANAEAARVRALTAERSKDFIVSVFKASDLETGDQQDPPASKLLERGVADIADKLRDEPAVRAELLETFGSIYKNLGHYKEARPLLEEVVAMRRAEGVDARASLAGALDALGGLLVAQHQPVRAVELHGEALAIRRELYGDDALATMRTTAKLAEAIRDSGDLARAEKLYRAVLEHEQARGAGDEATALAAENNLAMVLNDMRKSREARERMERVVERVRKQFPRSLRLCSAINDLGVVAMQQGDVERAAEAFDEAIALRTELVGADNPTVAMCVYNLGFLRLQSKRFAEALELMERARDVFVHTHGEDNPLYATVLQGLARLKLAQNAYDDAEDLCRKAIAIRVAAFDADNPDLAENRDLLGHILLVQKKPAEAAEAYTRAADAFERRLGASNLRTQMTRTNLGVCQLALKHYDEALRTLEPAFEGLRANPDATAQNRRFGALWIAKVHTAAGRPDEAARYEDLAKTFVDPPPARAP
jgi:tetratricopeptide (TPR) repeat protein